jgi:hypothetical protein
MDDWNTDGEEDWEQKWLKREQEITADTRCSFCKKRRDQVNRLIAGPGNYYICDECVDLYQDHIDKMARPLNLKEKTLQTCTTCGIIVPTSHNYCYNCGTHLK